MILRLLQFAALVAAFALTGKLDDPIFLSVRVWAGTLLIVAALIMALSQRYARNRIGFVFGITWLIVAGLAAQVLYAPYAERHAILQAADREPAQMAALGEHLVIGYDDPDDVRILVQCGLIGGIFVTQRNIVGKTASQLRAELMGFQDLRRRAGLPPLMIATDQEGGPVSRLSPLVPRQPPLATFANAPGSVQRATEYGDRQGRSLARLGINVNFSPVVDLKPDHPPDPTDRHTRIAERAIATDPITVAHIALAYSRALASQGVTPTLKHFPGLGDVHGDTHMRSAHLATPLTCLATRDWLPFRYVLDRAPAMLMVGHAALDAIDPNEPASLSRPVVTGLLRERWKYDGVLITDDLTMAAVNDLGLCRSSLKALEAGQDLLLIAYDWRKYYRVMDCLAQNADAGKLPDLNRSRRRLAAQPWRHPEASSDRGGS